jgi:uncharacterized protein YmfQ (DUF2313 family)
MPAPVYDDSAIATQFQATLPTGPIWPRDRDTVQWQILLALAPSFTRMFNRGGNLLLDAFPVAPVELLPEWVATLGLPDPCVGVSPTLQVRQQQVAARFIAGGGQSIAYFTQVAAALGYAITITQFAPSRFGQPFGLPFGGPAWAHAWQVNAPTFTIEYFKFGHGAFGDPFSSWNNNVLQCELQRLAPAQTVLIFSFLPPTYSTQFTLEFTGEFG